MNMSISPDLNTKTYIAPSPYRSAVLCSGEDTKSFLHRMSTQKINILNEKEGALNAFVDQKGRLLDVTFHLQTQNDECLLLGQQADGQELIDWLEKFHFIEKIEFNNLSASNNGILLFGANSESLLHRILETDFAPLAPWQFANTKSFYAVRVFDYANDQGSPVPCYYLTDVSGDKVDLEQRLQELSAERITQEDENDLRIKSGVPRAPQEINDSITPLALALHDSISWSKGCYIGQEVIARMDTYDRVTKNLALCTLKTNTAIEEQTLLYTGDKKIGYVTSASRLVDGTQHLLILLRLRENEIEDAGLHIKSDQGEQGVQIVKRLAKQEPHD